MSEVVEGEVWKSGVAYGGLEVFVHEVVGVQAWPSGEGKSSRSAFGWILVGGGRSRAG